MVPHPSKKECLMHHYLFYYFCCDLFFDLSRDIPHFIRTTIGFSTTVYNLELHVLITCTYTAWWFKHCCFHYTLSWPKNSNGPIPSNCTLFPIFHKHFHFGSHICRDLTLFPHQYYKSKNWNVCNWKGISISCSTNKANINNSSMTKYD